MVRPNPLRLLLAFTMVVVGAAVVGWAPPVEAEDLIFADGFESGDLSSWSLSVPWSIRWASVHRCHYSGDATPPAGATHLNRHYRDCCDQTVWTAVTWEITENSIDYQVPVRRRHRGLRTSGRRDLLRRIQKR